MFKQVKFKVGYFILLYTLINLIQAWFTELTSDEAYYWFCSLKLDWGYYDHPPFVGILTFIGRLFTESELGVRLFHVLAISIGLVALFKLVPDREKVYAGIIILALPLFNYISFIVFPDTLLVAVSAVILYKYRLFLVKNDAKSSLLLGCLFALALYCKYHAILIIFFIVISNLKLLKNKYFYLSLLIAFLLFLPHLYWQYIHDFATFRYHLVGRSSSFTTRYLFEYLTAQSVIIGIGLIFIPFVFRPSNQFEKTLKYISVGTLLFFALSSLRGFVHLHWTSISLVPIIIMGAKFYQSRKSDYMLNFLVTPFIVIIILARIYLMINIFGVNHLNADFYHDRPLWVEDISEISGECPVVFNTGNSGLREAPMYAFYTEKFSLALFPGEYKKSQYQILNYEDSVQFKSVVYVESNSKNGCTLLKTRMGRSIYYKKIENFSSFNNIAVSCEYKKEIVEQDSINMSATIFNHRNFPLNFSDEHNLYIQFTNKEGVTKEQIVPLKNVQTIMPNSKKVVHFNLGQNFLSPAEYSFIVGFRGGIATPSVNSERKKLLITIKQ
ncbi:glycosyltransferase family 39 protein [candidate division KSB1 bacterium]|nr:glycosyltransferase family 39 protein [candidate division KSB1 bacterium]